MWIRITNSATTRLYNEDLMDEPVSFNENGTAQVSREVGEAMVAHYDVIEPTDTEHNNS